MDNITESQYKFHLSLDMIYFLMYLLLKNRSNKIELVSHLVEKWILRVQGNAKRINVEESRKHAEKHDIDPDVASIIISAHQVESKILQQEFADHVKQLMINTFLQEEKDEKKK